MDGFSFTVCTRCFTYNHEAYIRDALVGFVLQETDFPVVYVIVDDASLDKTASIATDFFKENFIWEDCKTAYLKVSEWGTVSYAQHRTNKNCFFAIILLNENHYQKGKSKFPYFAEWMDVSEFCAICEGDDYWIDPCKLQNQVEVLRKDETLMAVVTNSKVVDNTGNELKEKQLDIVPNNKEGRYDLRSFIYEVHRYPTATVCYRNTHAEEIQRMVEHTKNPYLGDWTLWIVLHVFGDFYYLDRVTSAYRINPTSLTHTVNRVGRSKAHWTICRAVQEILPDEYSDIKNSLNKDSWMWSDLAMAYRHEHQYFRMLWCFLVSFVKNPGRLIREFKKRLSNR